MARWLSIPALVLLVSTPALAGPLRVGIALVLERGESSSASGWLRLEVPLERLAQPGRISERPAEPKRESAEALEPPLEPAVAPEAVPPKQPERVRLVRSARFDTAFARAIVREALRLQGQSSARERLDTLAGRSRLSAILPELMLRAARSTDQSLRLTPSGAERYDFTQTGGDDLLFEARATWNLDRLVFTDEEIRVEHLRREREEASERLALIVLKHLFSWQRAEARLAAGNLDAEAELSAQLDSLEAEASLDVLTDGFFGRRLAERDAAAKMQANHARSAPLPAPREVRGP